MKNILILGGKGYIGSRLYQYLYKFNYHINTIDIVDNLNVKNLDKDFLNFFNVVIYLAGDSAATLCEDKPVTTWNNNVENFIDVVNKLNRDQLFIYASSGSVYGKSGATPQLESASLSEPIGQYDLQKQILDQYMLRNDFFDRWFGFRFGTVCGYSPNPRNRLLLNSMTKSSLTNNKVSVTNASSFRAILSLHDLCRAMHRAISADDGCGIYNLATFNTSFGDLAERASNFLGVPMECYDGQDKYSFALNTTKFQKDLNFEFVGTLESIINECKNNNFSGDRL